MHAVSSVRNEEKEKSKRKLNLILHNIPESNNFMEIVVTQKQHDTDTAIGIINQHLRKYSSFYLKCCETWGKDRRS